MSKGYRMKFERDFCSILYSSAFILSFMWPVEQQRHTGVANAFGGDTTE